MNTPSSNSFQRYLTVSEEKQLFKSVALFADILAQRDLHWMKLLRHTGMRVGSLAGLTVFDARDAIANKRLNLPDSICKGGRGYSIALNKHALTALRGLIRLRTKQGHALINDQPLIISRKGGALSIRSYQHRMQMWVRAADIGIAATPHFFRHTVGNRIINNSTAPNPQRLAQAALNHANIATTSIYTQPSREDMERAMEEMG